MEYSLLEGARAAKVAKSTVLRAIRSGRLSARREEDGTYRIDASELARVYDLRHLAQQSTGSENQSAPRGELGEPEREPREPGVDVGVLQVRVEMLEAHLERERHDRDREREREDRERETILQRERDTVDDLRRRLDRAEERVLALSAQVAQPAPQMPQERVVEVPVMVEPPKSTKGFLARLLGL